ncbi:hypothetical protein [Aquimarina sp. MMG016]|uniref:hypothetical protein n=1 Tax=Aquimarina sp. MMG016 TaxID=2822690 RepID=UPI001B3A507B|nr:hypothetical protein [Aquimarina sp. MMG016]MBQ4822590.1 hypothetical protein [Aquimarina sp. MMG016]
MKIYITLFITLALFTVSCSKDDSPIIIEETDIIIAKEDLVGVYNVLTRTDSREINGEFDYQNRITDFTATEEVAEFTYTDNGTLQWRSKKTPTSGVGGFCWSWILTDGMLSLDSNSTTDEFDSDSTEVLSYEKDGILEIKHIIKYIRENGNVDIYTVVFETTKIEQATIDSSGCRLD